MKNILKTMALLTLGASIVPVCRAEENDKAETQFQRDFKKEDACSNKLALTELASIYGIAGGIVTGIATQSILAGGAVCAIPIALHIYLYKKYKPMFDEERFNWVLTHAEDKAFYYGMMPMGILMMLAGGTMAATSLVAVPAVAIGTPVNAIATNLGIAKEGAAFIGAGVVAAIQAAFTTRGDNIQKGYEEYQKITWSETLLKYGVCLGYSAASALIVTGAVLGSAGII